MKRLILFLIAQSVSLTSFAQVKFKITPDRNRIDQAVCRYNHLGIINNYQDQLYSEIGRLTRGIEIEKKNKNVSPQSLAKLYDFLSYLTVKQMLINATAEQYKRGDYSKVLLEVSKYDGIFHPEKLRLKINEEVDSILEKAQEKHHEKSYDITHQAMHDIEHHLKTEIVLTLSEKSVQNAARGMLAKLVGTVVLEDGAEVLGTQTLKFLFVHHGMDIFVNVLRGTGITLLTYPFHGYKSAPETEWMELLSQYPEMIVNPDWMTEARIEVNPLRTHCLAIQRQPEAMNSIIEKLISKEEKNFKEIVLKFKAQVMSNTSIYESVQMENDATQVTSSKSNLPQWAQRN